MDQRPAYPTDYTNYEDVVKAAYGDIDAIERNTPLIRNTLISKRFCSLFPVHASSQLQQIVVSTEERLVKALSKCFSEMILPMELHQELYRTTSKEDLTRITNGINSALDKGYDDRHPYNQKFPVSKSFRKGYRKLLMPFTFEPIPSHLINAVKQALKKREFEFLSPSPYQHSPVDLFVLDIQKSAEDYYQDRLNHMLSTYPVFPDGQEASLSIWGPVLAIKWYEIIQEYIRTVEESQYKREPLLLKVLSQKAISLEIFLALKIETALALQNEAEQAYMASLEAVKNDNAKAEDSKYTKLIPWRRGEENLHALWNILVENGCIEQGNYQKFIDGHFQISTSKNVTTRSIIITKIVWLTSLNNLLRLLEGLVNYNIINVLPFGKKTDTEIAGRINNLIQTHFANNDGSDFKLDAIRKAAQRMRNPKTKIDRSFNGIVLKEIRSIQ